MAEANRKIGSIDCPVCGETLPVRQNGRDTLNISCPWCGVSSYAKGGSAAHKIITGWLGPGHEPAPQPVAAEPAPAPAPAQKKQPASMPWEL